MEVEIKVRCEDWVKLAASLAANSEGLSLNQYVVKLLKAAADQPLKRKVAKEPKP